MSELPAPAGHAGSPQQELGPFVPTRRDYEFDAFYRQEMPRVTVFLMHVGATAYEAADAAHEAFCALLPDKWLTVDHPRAYLRTTAYHCYLRQANSRSVPTDAVPDRPGGTCPVDVVLLTEQQWRIADALSRLPAAEREAMAWSLDGFSHEETALHLGKKPAAVRKNFQRARERLMTLLDLGCKEVTNHERAR